MYQLDLSTILHLLALQTGRLYTADVHIAGVEPPCQVFVSLHAGHVEDCRIIDGDHVVRSGEDALQTVFGLGSLCWTYLPEEPPSPRVHAAERVPSPLALASRIPHRTRVVSVGELARWSRLHRCVYNMTDGCKSIATIAQLLSQHPDVVAAALLQLQQNEGVLALASSSEAAQQRTGRDSLLVSVW